MKIMAFFFLLAISGSVFLFLPKIAMATPYTDAAQNCYNNYGGGKNKTELKKCLADAGKLSDKNSYIADAAIDTAVEAPKILIAFVLKAILKFVILLLNLAEIIFQWIVNPDVMKGIIDNSAIYKSWMAVRDVFNIIFIMTLLFSAFATIFQISKYNYKNILLNLILMALLVNFSYPIARFLIDVSNVVMYGFLQNMSGNYFMTIIENSGVTGLFNTDSTDLFYLISTIIFTFIFAITLDVVAVLLLIRVIVLAIYVIFSPLGFVGSVLPGTKLASEGSKWWTDFLKNCFAGPTMIFMLYIANSTMVAISPLKNSGSDLGNIVSSQLNSNIKNTTGLQQLIISAAFVSLPIIILWLGVIAAQSSGIAGAGAVVAQGKKFGKWLAKNPLGGSVGYGLRKSGVTGAAKQRWEQMKKNSPLGSEKTAQREAGMAARFGVRGALEKDMRRRAEEHKKNGTTDDELKELAAKGDAAAAYRLAEDKIMDQETYDKFIANPNSQKDPSYVKAINSKVKQNRLDIVANNRSSNAEELARQSNIDGATNASTHANITLLANNARAAGMSGGTVSSLSSAVSTAQYIANQQMGNLSADQWNSQNWTDILQPIPPLPTPSTPQQRQEWAEKMRNRYRIVRATQTAWASMKLEAKAEVKKRLSPNNSAALASIDIT